MIFRTAVRDCLYLNWALPGEMLPPLPEPLRYDYETWRGRPYSFVSAALFRLQGLRLQSLPLIRLSHPQFVLRLCILDREGLPSFFLRTVLIPVWALPAARLVARQPARGGRFRYPRREEGSRDRSFWEVRRGAGRLALHAEPGSPRSVRGPDLGSWERTVAYFQRRRSGYFRVGSELRRVQFPPRRSEPVPLAVELDEDALLSGCLARDSSVRLPELHSAWLCPEESFLFELGTVPEPALRRQVPAPG